MLIAYLMVSVCSGPGQCPPKQEFGEPWSGPEAIQQCEQEIRNIKAQLRQKAPKAIVLMHCRTETVPDAAKLYRQAFKF